MVFLPVMGVVIRYLHLTQSGNMKFWCYAKMKVLINKGYKVYNIFKYAYGLGVVVETMAVPRTTFALARKTRVCIPRGPRPCGGTGNGSQGQVPRPALRVLVPASGHALPWPSAEGPLRSGLDSDDALFCPKRKPDLFPSIMFQGFCC